MMMGKSKVQKVLKSDPDSYAFKEFSWTVDGSQQITADYITLSIKTASADKHNSYAAIDNTFFSEECQFFFAQNSDPKKGTFFLMKNECLSMQIFFLQDGFSLSSLFSFH